MPSEFWGHTCATTLAPPLFQRVICNAKCWHSTPMSGPWNYWDRSFKILFRQFKNEKKNSLNTPAGWWSDYDLTKGGKDFSPHSWVSSVYGSSWPSHRVSLTLPHNTNLHCMSQLGACPDASHNKKNSNKHRGCTPSAQKAAMFKCCLLCSFTVKCFFFLFLAHSRKWSSYLSFTDCVVIMVVESTVETVKDWLELRLAQWLMQIWSR